jgi:catechol 2,3-dioxygenase-like lactoylglutathione lyase family enzyme
MTTDRRSIIGAAVGLGLGASPGTAASADTTAREPRVVGLGGVFLKVEDAKAWRAWYERVLGVRFEAFGAAVFPHPREGVTQIAPFGVHTTYFAPSTAPFMINLIVENIDGLVARAAKEGVACLGRQDASYGRFASFLDPAGIKVELWEPVGAPPSAPSKP